MTRPSPALLAEAALALSRAWLALRLRPFAAVMARIGDEADRIPCPPDEAERIDRALAAWGRRVPWRWKCFERGLAAQRMLAARGYRATVHYGARQRGGIVESHVWVTSGGQPVTGCDNAADFAELQRFGRDAGSARVHNEGARASVGE